MNKHSTKETIDFNTVMSLDIKICIVLEAERVPNKDRLLKLVVGTEKGSLTAVTNLGKDYEPEEFVNKSFPFILNMTPTVIGGIESEAMIIAGNSNGRLDKMCLLDVTGSMPIGTTLL